MAVYDLHVIPFGGGPPVASYADDGAGDTRMAATVGQVSWVLNQPGSMTFRAPIDHPATVATSLLTTEVELRRDGTLLWRGIPIQRERSGGAVTFSCAGLLWPFTRWFVGPNLFDYTGGALRFNQGFTGWNLANATAVLSSTVTRDGGQAAQLTNTAADQNSYIEYTFTVASTGQGLYVEVTAEYLIDPGTPWVGSAFEERGVYVSAPGSLPDGTPSWEPITNSSPHGQWTRATTGIALAGGGTNVPVTVRLYSPGGRIWWDNGTAKREQSVAAEQTVGEDAAFIFARLANYAFDNKTDLGLTINNPASNVMIRDAYQFYELPNIFTLMESYPARGLLDFAVIDRTLTTFSPRRGTYRPAKPLTVAPDAVPPVVGVLGYGHRTDAANTATRVIRTGDGTGATQDVAQGANTTATNGLVLEHVGVAASHYGPAGLRSAVAVDLARLRRPVTLPSAEVPAAGWLGQVVEGDTVDVHIQHGAVQETSRRRVLAVNLTPTTDTVSFDLADEAEPA